MKIFTSKKLIISILVILFVLFIAGNNPKQNKKTDNLFGIYYSTLDGKNMKLIIGDSYREMNHARVSPDKKWVTFTRFNKKSSNGLAVEDKSGYDTTEIMIAKLDGSELQSIVPPKKGIVAANSYWTPDGNGILYISNDNKNKITQINKIDLKTKKITTLATPKGMWVLDPNQVGNIIVFPAVDKKKNKNVLWIMNPDGSNAKQITNPIFTENKNEKLQYRLGDFDPKISPDGTKIAFMRQFAQDDWRIMVKNIFTGEEKDLSKKKTIDAMPEWSSDGKLLIFWHIDKKNVENMGIYTIKSNDGSDRKKVLLPKGFFYTIPAFFPNEGSSNDTRIIFSAKKVPGL